MGWGSYDRSEPKPGGRYFRLEDGEAGLLVVRGLPAKFYTMWRDGKSERLPEWEAGAAVRYIVCCWNVDSRCSQTWEMSRTVLTMLDDIMGALGPDADTRVLRVSRKGSGKGTTYILMPVRECTEEEQLLMAGEPIEDLRDQGCEYLSGAPARPVASRPVSPLPAPSPVPDVSHVVDADIPF